MRSRLWETLAERPKNNTIGYYRFYITP